jgi:hypothetical protein
MLAPIVGSTVDCLFLIFICRFVEPLPFLTKSIGESFRVSPRRMPRDHAIISNHPHHVAEASFYAFTYNFEYKVLSEDFGRRTEISYETFMLLLSLQTTRYKFKPPFKRITYFPLLPVCIENHDNSLRH